MIKTRFYHIGKAAMLAAFLFLTPLSHYANTSAVTAESQTRVRAVKQDKSKRNTKVNRSSTFENPDFAFPETVEKGAEPMLRKALDDGNGLEAMKAALQLIVARNMVTTSSFGQNIAMLDTMSAKLPQPYASLCRLLQANLYDNMYSSDRWNYMQRTLPLDTYPEDPKSWSGALFAKKVLSLVAEATANPEEARRMPIAGLAPILNNWREASLSGLSVWDFIVYNSADLLSDFAERNIQAVIPFRADAGRTALTEGEKCAEKSDSLISGLVNYNRTSGNIPALAVAVERYAQSMGVDRRSAYLRGECMALKGSPDAGRLLHDYFLSLDLNGNYGSPAVREAYGLMEEWLAENRASRFAKLVEFDIARIKERKISIHLPDNVLPGDTLKGTMDLDNTPTGYVLLYRVPSSMLPKGGLNRTSFLSKSKFIRSIKVDAAGSVPFSAKREFVIPPLEAGYYVAIPSATPTLSKRWRKEVSVWSLSTINVSELALITSGDMADKEATRIYVVDGRTQRPVEGATVQFFKGDGMKPVATRVTNADGFCGFLDGERVICVSKGNDVRWDHIYFYAGGRRSESVEAYANILTDLSLYKPGDTVRFSLVGWTSESHDNRLLKNARVKVSLRDANRKEVDTVTLTTDRFGRCDGSFTLPENGLQGSYSLYPEFDDFKGKIWGIAAFQVQEYKAPGFLVTVASDEKSSYSVGDVVRFTGKALTYSGMPLGGCQVSYNVTWEPWWRWYDGGGSASYGGTTTTDAEGVFTVELPTANLKGSRYERGLYSIRASVTSPSGETQTAPAFRFSLGDGLTVNPSIPDILEITGDTVRFNVPVYDMLGHPVVKTVNYTLSDVSTGKEIAGGSFTSPMLDMAASALPSARYRLSFRLPGDTVPSDCEVALFRKGDSRPPYATPLWLPERKIVCKDGVSEVEIKVGSGFKGSWILCEVSDENGFISRRWLQADGENISVPVKAPSAKSRVWATFCGMHDLQPMLGTVILIPESQTRKLKVKATSFRDHITAGDREQWKFTFTVDGKPQSGIPAMAVMSNKALNAIEPFEWYFNPGDGNWWLRTSLRTNAPGTLNTSATFSTMPRYPSVASPFPEWNTYGFGFGTASRYYATRARKSIMTSGSADAMPEEMLNTMYVTEAPLMAESKAMADSNTMIRGKVESAEEEADEAAPAPAEGGSANASDKERERLRPVEMPLAFFMPSLTGDADGNVEVGFETPNFNTTWQFQIMGYTEDLLTAGLTADAVASKPVMVQSNLPRFLRSGDRAFITALLFNNSTDPLPLHGEIEVFDPATGKTIVSQHAGAVETAPSASRTISVEFLVPGDVTQIGVRAYAFGGDHSDGEQDLVPVLPSSTPVIESTQFYIGTGAGIFSQRLPKLRKDANITLKYCDNPMWECILALPSISKPDSKSVTTLMKALYANSVALHVAEKYPSVRQGLAKALAAQESGDTAVLRSNLQKDASLKTVALDNTPWVNNAEAETRRMKGLSTLLDQTASRNTTDKILDEVMSLQRPDGGWSWCPGMESSVFMTENVLLHFGMMKQIGCLPSATSVSAAIRKGVAFCDRETYDDYVKSDRKFSTTSMLSYLYIRSFFDVGDGPRGFGELRKKALESIVEEWDRFSVYDKATAAILLSRSKGYGKISRLILESLRQLASKSEAKGWWYDNLSSGPGGWSKLITTAQALQAYAEIEPSAPAVDGLRQWLVLQKETEDWGSNPYTVEVIQSILSCGSDWTASAQTPKVFIGGKPVELPASGLLTGMLTVDLDPKAASGKTIAIEKKSEGPAWGGVISQYVAPVKDVSAERCENLKIEKRIYVISDTEAGEKAEAKSLKVGDKVRVTLTVTCDKDMNYVALVDERAACLEPDAQLSEYTVTDGLWAYREVRDTKTSFFIGFLPKGVNVISYDCHVDREGDYALGIASVQSQYSPAQVAHSAGQLISVKGK